jgi:hypothetical protein
MKAPEVRREGTTSSASALGLRFKPQLFNGRRRAGLCVAHMSVGGQSSCDDELEGNEQ